MLLARIADSAHVILQSYLSTWHEMDEENRYFGGCGPRGRRLIAVISNLGLLKYKFLNKEERKKKILETARRKALL